MVTREQLLSILPKPTNTEVLVKDNHRTGDIITQMLLSDKINRKYGKLIAPLFKGNSPLETCRNIWDFLRNEMTYHVENPRKQTTKEINRFIYDGYGDCKHFASLFATVMEALGIRGAYRFVAYQPNSDPTHVYVVGFDNQKNIIYCDGCIPFFNTQKKFSGRPIDKPFTAMPLFHLAGTETTQDTYLGDIGEDSYFEEATEPGEAVDDTDPDQVEEAGNENMEDELSDLPSGGGSSSMQSYSPAATTQAAILPAGSTPATFPALNPHSNVRVPSKYHLVKSTKKMAPVLKNPSKIKPRAMTRKITPANIFRKKKFGFFGDPESQGVEYLSYVGCVAGVDVYQDAMGNIFTKAGKALVKASKAAGKGIVKAAKATGGAIKTVAKKYVAVLKKVGLAIPRNSYLLMLRANIHGMATRANKAVAKNPDKVKSVWEKLGGDFNSFKAAAKSGASRKAILGIENLTDYDNAIGIAPLAAAASAAPILAAIIPIIKSIVGSDPQEDKLLQTSSAEYEKTTGQKISETQFSQEPEKNLPAKTGFNMGTATKILIPVAVGGAALIFLSKRKK